MGVTVPDQSLVLPVAGLLLRLGQPDLLDIGMLAAAGNAVFSNLGLIFAIGVAVGFTNYLVDAQVPGMLIASGMIWWSTSMKVMTISAARNSFQEAMKAKIQFDEGKFLDEQREAEQRREARGR